uniref:NADH:ubiquinone reductase (H(+)-translocating) n=1 Tax=Pomphorhynchus tereticollis TaxID=255491 RepID=A0A806GRI9_9BILA|nr:NADH dehydrogenase subunit 5 [Pomphorhynchus tereticollis]AFJ14718.1 NADH dehydrogenase subunit 5 [Pomphorhynchus tereticollis]
MAGLGVVVSLLLSIMCVVAGGVGVSVLGVEGVLSGLVNVSLGAQDLAFAFCYGGGVSPMVVVVMMVFSMVLVFTVVYMVSEVEYNSFLAFVGLFVIGMLILVSAQGVYSGLVGWEILGVVSFILIGYYGSRTSWGSGLVTMGINRVGDVWFMVLSLIMVFLLSGLNGGGVLSSVIWVVGLLCGVLILTKSSQFPCSGWHPLAMAALTSVSALVHSFTLVVAGLVVGVYLWEVMSIMGVIKSLCLLMGVLTLISSSFSVLWEMDFKKVVGLSTSIHFKIMLLMLVVSGMGLAMVYMVVHALFKSLLFVAVVYIILLNTHDQDYRGVLGLGGLFSVVSGMVVLSSVWSLVGLVGFSGWVTKDVLLESVYVQGGGVVVSMLVVALSCSLMYSWKLLVTAIGSGAARSLEGVGWSVGGGLFMAMGAMSCMGVSVGWVVEGSLDSSVAVGVIGGLEKWSYWMVGVLVIGLILGWSLVSPVGANMLYLQDLYRVVVGGLTISGVLLFSKVEIMAGSVIVGSVVEGESGSLQAAAGLLKALDMWAMFVGVLLFTVILIAI